MTAKAGNSKAIDGILSAQADCILSDVAIEGYVDLFGYHSLAGGWFFAGWITKCDGIVDSLREAVAYFGDETASNNVSAILFARDDVSSEAIGFLVFLQTAAASENQFRFMRIEIGGKVKNIHPVMLATRLPESKLIPKLNFLVLLGEPSIQRREMELLLDGHSDMAGQGYIEYFGYHQAAGGWLLSGWVSHAWTDGQTLDRVVISFEDGDVRGEVVASLFARAELPDGAQGVIVYVRAQPSAFGPLCTLSMNVGGIRTVLQPISSVPQLREAELTARLKSNLLQAKPGLQRDRLGNLLARRPYAGEDTLDALAPAINLYIDEAIKCGASDLVLMGWMLAKSDDIREIRVRCGTRVSILKPRHFVKIERHDVLAEFTKHGFDNAECGFIAYLPAALDADARPYIEVETQRYETAYRSIGRPVRTGMAAIQKLLGAAEIRFADILPAFNRVLGPAVEALNKERLAIRPAYQTVEYGEAPAAPKFSVIVPLYGRLDYVEYQFALFSARPEYSEIEFIYVLDDPPKRREAQSLFGSVYERFKIPFRAILLDRNLGFAPANNIGLQHARGKFIAYLNSDVFPGTPDWLERLSARLEADPQLGVVGPLLLFEDGSVQHRGMYFEPLAEYGNWFFCQHLDKGMRYTGGNELQHFISITGACMVLRRELANLAGGFDETYIIGDFEDSDLCLKLQAMGYKCAVDPNVRLYHLERKSQLSSAVTWRSNLTAYNAWQHDGRWAETIIKKQNPGFESIGQRA